MTNAALESEPSAARRWRVGGRARPGLRDLLTAIFLHRRAAAIAFVVPILLAVAGLLLRPPAAQVEAEALVTPASAATPINAGVLLQAAGEFGPARVYPDLAGRSGAAGEAARRLSRDLTLRREAGGRLVLTLIGQDPRVAASLLDAIVAVAQRRSRPEPPPLDDGDVKAVDAAIVQLGLTHAFADYETALAAIETARAAARERLAEQEQILAAGRARASALRRRGGEADRLRVEVALAEAEAAGAERARAAAARHLTELERRRDGLVRLGPDYRSLTRERSALEQAVAARAARDTAARLQAAPDLRLVRPPTAAPQGGERWRLLGAGLALGFVAAGLTVAALALGSDTMVTPRDAARKLGAPVVLAPPRRGRGEAVLNYDDCKLLLLMAAAAGSGQGRVLQLIGPSGGEGVTCLALELARQAASAGARRVLLIDVEPSQGRGAARRLADGGAVINPVSSRVMRIGDTSLFVSAPVGGRDLAVAEHEWAQVIGEARRNFDLVLIDAPALALSNTGLVTAAYADLLLAVVAAEETRAPVARNMLERLSGAGAPPPAVIFNRRRFHIPEAIYSRL